MRNDLLVALLLLTEPAGADCDAVLQLLAADDLVHARAVYSRCQPAEPQYHFATARIHLTGNAPDRAADELSAALRQQPLNGEYHWWLVHAYHEQSLRAGLLTQIGLAKKAGAELQQAVKLDPNNLAAHLELIDFYASAPRVFGGDHEKAAALAREMAHHDRFEGMLAQARLALANTNVIAAENDYRLLVEQFPGRAEGVLAAGFFHLNAAHLPEAISEFRRAQSLAPQSRLADYGLGAALARSGDVAGAEAPLRRYLGHIVQPGEPTHAHTLYHLALAQKAAGNVAASVETLRTALRLDPGYGNARRLLAELQK